MKEITRVVTANITFIQKMSDEEADQLLKLDKDPFTRRLLANRIKADLKNADHVEVTDIQDFVTEKNGS